MPSEWENNLSSSSAKVSSSSGSSLSASSSTATSPEPNSNGNNNNNNHDSDKNGHAKDCSLKASTMSHDPTPYVARARVTRPTPPKPSTNPMQFVQIKPCNLYQSAQQQLKKVEEIKKVKEVIKEEPEDWQNNLDNWKSSRRKRVEHIIERVVEVKKLELEEHDRTRRKSKTFSEMMEERGERGRTRPKLQSLASYNEDEANDLSDLGIGTSSASGKSSISEDCEVHSIVSEPPEVEHLSSYDIENNSCQPCQDNIDRISSLGGYETSSTAPITSSPDPYPYEYTYEGAIEDYKSRVSKASAASIYKKSEFDRKSTNFNDQINDLETSVTPTVKKEDLPKIDISKKRELFENQDQAKTSKQSNHEQPMDKKPIIPSEFTNVRSIKDRLCSLEKKPTDLSDDQPTNPASMTTSEILPGEVYSIKERMQCLKQQQNNSVNSKPNINKVVAEVVAVPPLKDRLSSLQNAVTKEEVVKKPVVLVDEYQLEMLKNEDMARRQLETSKDDDRSIIVEKAPSDDSGINTTDEKIDQNPETTDDDDDDDVTVAMMTSSSTTAPIPSKSEAKVPPITVAATAASSNNEFQGELDSSVSFLKSQNLNTPPTVVSLVDKPIVVNDDHGKNVGVGSVGDGGGTNAKGDESCEVNHAQNLLKMFKLAFDDDNDIDVISDSVKSNQVEVELDTLNFNVAAKKSPLIVDEQVQKPPETQIRDPVKNDEISKITTPTSPRLGLRSPETNSNVVLKIDNSQHKTSPVISDSSEEPSYVRTSVSSKIQQLNKISADAEKSPNLNAQKSPNSATEKSLNPSSKKSPNPTAEKSPNPAIIKSQNPTSEKSPNSTIENSANSAIIMSQNPISEKSPNLTAEKSPNPAIIKSQNPFSEKSLNPTTEKSPNSAFMKSQNPTSVKSPNLTSEKTPNPTIQNSPNPDKTPSSPILIRNPTVDRDGSESPPKFVSVSATVQQLNSLSSVSQEIPKPNSPKSVTSRIQQASKSQKSPIYENITIPPQSPLGNVRKVYNSDNNGRVEIFNSKSMPSKPKSPEVLPKITKTDVGSQSFQQSALNDFIKDLETTTIIHKNVSKQSNTNQAEPKKSETIIKPLETKPIPMPQNSSQPTSPLPLDQCVDILQSFLAAERSMPSPPNNSPIVKSTGELNSHPSDNFIRQESAVEVPCSKLDVRDLPDPNFIRTPCINVNCRDEALTKESIGTAQAIVRDSVSSAGDSSPSSDITVIFKGAPPESPKPNKSSLMEIAQRMGSPVATRRDPMARQKEPIREKPCLKINVKDLPDPNFIRTECIEVDKNACCPNSPLTPSTPGLALQKTNADILKKTCEDVSNSPPLSPILGGRSATEKPNFMIARVEVVETKIKVTTTNDADGVPPAVPTTAPPPIPPSSPKSKTKSVQNSKPKNIFEFLKKNFQSKSDSSSSSSTVAPIEDEFKPISVDNSKFYVPSDVISTAAAGSQSKDTNGVNIEITKKITSDAIVEQSDSDLNLTDEINDILDEEISKLVVEDAKL